MVDKKSEKNVYVVERKEFYSKHISNIEVAKDLDYSNLHLKAAQNNNLGTVMILPDNTNILFRDITVQDLADKASNEGLYEKDSSKPLKNEVLISMEEGGGHFSAIFSNGTYHFRTDFYPERKFEEGDGLGLLYEIGYVLFNSLFFNARTSDCELQGSELREGRYFIEGSLGGVYLDQFAGIKKPKLGEYTLTFSISDEQYGSAHEEQQRMRGQCASGKLGYGPFVRKEDNSFENCFTSVDRTMESIGFKDSFMKFFLDYQLLFAEDMLGRYFVDYKYDQYKNPVIKEISHQGSFFSQQLLMFVGLKFISPDTKWTPYMALLSGIVPALLDLTEEESCTEEELREEYLTHYSNPDPDFIVSNCIARITEDSTIIDPDRKCLFDREGISSTEGDEWVFDTHGNLVGKKLNVSSHDCKIDVLVEYNKDMRYPIEKEFSEMIGEVA